MLKVFSFLAAAVLSIITVYADYFVKEASLQKSPWNLNLLIGGVIYGLTAIGWVFLMKSMKLSTIGVVYGVFCIIFLALLSVLIYHEKFSALELLGVILGISSIAILYRFS